MLADSRVLIWILLVLFGHRFLPWRDSSFGPSVPAVGSRIVCYTDAIIDRSRGQLDVSRVYCWCLRVNHLLNFGRGLSAHHAYRKV